MEKPYQKKKKYKNIRRIQVLAIKENLPCLEYQLDRINDVR